VTSLGYALAFAAAGQRRNSEFSLLQEWQKARAKRQQFASRLTPAGGSDQSEREYLRSIRRDEERKRRK
jgi:hypothetical protein